MTLKNLLSVAAFVGSTAFVPSVQAGIAVIVNPNLPESQLSDSDVKRIFLGKDTAFPGGEEAIPIENNNASDLYAMFHQKVTRKSPKQLRAYWAKLTFTGKGVPPREVSSEEVKKLVANNQNIIGYIDTSAVDDSVKVVFTVD